MLLFLVLRFPKLRLLLLITHHLLIICPMHVNRIRDLTSMLATLEFVVTEFRAHAKCGLLLLVAELRLLMLLCCLLLLLCTNLLLLCLSYSFEFLFVPFNYHSLLRVV